MVVVAVGWGGGEVVVVQVQVLVNVSYSNDACEMRTMILQRHVLEDEDDEFAHLSVRRSLPATGANGLVCGRQWSLHGGGR